MPRTPKKTEPSAFGRRLAEALEKSGRERKDLAEHLHVTPQSIGQVLSGSTIAMTADNCVRTARFLGVSAFWLATGEGPMVESSSSGIGTMPGAQQLLDDIGLLLESDRRRFLAEIHARAEEMREYDRERGVSFETASKERELGEIVHSPPSAGRVVQEGTGAKLKRK